jgi:hypothetical protein
MMRGYVDILPALAIPVGFEWIAGGVGGLVDCFLKSSDITARRLFLFAFSAYPRGLLDLLGHRHGKISGGANGGEGHPRERQKIRAWIGYGNGRRSGSRIIGALGR